jgi:hypothetical protein
MSSVAAGRVVAMLAVVVAVVVMHDVPLQLTGCLILLV